MAYARFATALLIAALAPLAAQAQMLDLTPDPLRFLSDPAFLPVADQFDGTTGYTYTETRGTSFDDVTGAERFQLHRWANQFAQSIAFGITDDLSLNASISYEPFDEAKHELNGTSVIAAKQSGWTDPFFGVTWRAVDQAQAPLNLDFFGSYSPDLIGARTGTADEDASAGRGGQAGRVGAAVSEVMRGFTIYGSFFADLLGQRTVDNSNNGSKAITDSHTNYTLALQTQTRFTEALSLNAGVDHVWASNASVFQTGTGLSHLLEPGDSTNVDAAINYHVVPNRLVASLTYEHDFLDPQHTVFAPAAGLDNNTLKDRSADLYGAKLSYALP